MTTTTKMMTMTTTTTTTTIIYKVSYGHNFRGSRGLEKTGKPLKDATESAAVREPLQLSRPNDAKSV